MPRIKRWFPVSHEINHNPTMRQLARQFGLAGWRIWFEILSIADRAGGEVDCTSEGAISRLTSAAETRMKVTRSVLEALFKAGSIVLHDELKHVTRVSNYSDYHRSEERKTVPTRPDLTRPNQTIKNKTPSAVVSEPLVLPDWLDSETWTAYVEYRKTSRHPLTAHGKKLAIKQLKSLMDAGNDPKAVLEQSILSGWRGLFEIKGGSNANGTQRTVEPKGFAGIRAALARKQARANEP